MKPLDMIMGLGSLVGLERGKVPRVGILPRYAMTESEMRWFDVPAFNIVHTINAREEDGDVVILVAPNILCIEHALEKMELVHSIVEMVRTDGRMGTVTRRSMSAGNLEFGAIHPGYVGRRNRYAYLGVGDPMPKLSGVVKLDFERVGKGGAIGGDCMVARREYGARQFGGAPVFVPAMAATSSREEDEGYVGSYVHDERRGGSRFVVMDAQSPELEILAEVSLPRRVSYGFHGLFVTQAELQSQKNKAYVSDIYQETNSYP